MIGVRNNKLAVSILGLIFFLMFFTNCSEYQKLVKSSDFEAKYQGALKYYEKGDYVRALPLFEDLLPYFRGTQRSEDVYYYYCQTLYKQGDYILASYHFGRFHETFPTSPRAEEALFLAARCYYLLSPPYSLDQEDTYKSIQYLQQFINKYPQSALKDSCRVLLDKLFAKLERKDYENAYLYYKTEYYQAAIVALQNFIKDWPASTRVEEAMYLIVKSWYVLYSNSIESKKAERLEETLESYLNFVDKFPNSVYLKDLEKIYDDISKEKQKFANSKT